MKRVIKSSESDSGYVYHEEANLLTGRDISDKIRFQLEYMLDSLLDIDFEEDNDDDDDYYYSDDIAYQITDYAINDINKNGGEVYELDDYIRLNIPKVGAKQIGVFVIDRNGSTWVPIPNLDNLKDFKYLLKGKQEEIVSLAMDGMYPMGFQHETF